MLINRSSSTKPCGKFHPLDADFLINRDNKLSVSLCNTSATSGPPTSQRLLLFTLTGSAWERGIIIRQHCLSDGHLFVWTPVCWFAFARWEWPEPANYDMLQSSSNQNQSYSAKQKMVDKAHASSEVEQEKQLGFRLIDF